jgi:peptidoglycan/LPS O-acetylase OafA/YrhL
MGIALWLWTRRRMRFEHLALVLLAGLLSEYVQDDDWHSTKALGLMVLLVLLAAGPDWGGPARLLARPMSWLASISFGVYLANQQIGYEVALGLHALGVGVWWRLVAVVGTAIGVGWLLTRFVERPTHRWLVGECPRHLVGVQAWLRTQWLLLTRPSNLTDAVRTGVISADSAERLPAPRRWSARPSLEPTSTEGDSTPQRT